MAEAQLCHKDDMEKPTSTKATGKCYRIYCLSREPESLVRINVVEKREASFAGTNPSLMTVRLIKKLLWFLQTAIHGIPDIKTDICPFP